MVLVELYTDGGNRVSEENAALEDSKFQTAAQPFYALMDGDANVVATFPGSTRDAADFLAFLKKRPA
jgi:hypothetical protein